MGKLTGNDIKVLFEKCAITKEKLGDFNPNDIEFLRERGDILDVFNFEGFSLNQDFYDYIGYSDILGFNLLSLDISKSSLIELIDSLPIGSNGIVDFSSLNCDKKTESMLAILAMRCELIKPVLFGNSIKYKRTKEKDEFDLGKGNTFYWLFLEKGVKEILKKINNDTIAVQHKLNVEQIQKLFGLFGLQVKINDDDWNKLNVSGNHVKPADYVIINDDSCAFIGDSSQVKIEYKPTNFCCFGGYRFGSRVVIRFEDYSFVFYFQINDNKFEKVTYSFWKQKSGEKKSEALATLEFSTQPGTGLWCELANEPIEDLNNLTYKYLSYDIRDIILFTLDYNKSFSTSPLKLEISHDYSTGAYKLSSNGVEHPLSLIQAMQCLNLIASHPKNKELIAQVIANAKTYAPEFEEFISANFPHYNQLKNNNPTDYTIRGYGELINLDEIIKSTESSQEEFIKK